MLDAVRAHRDLFDDARLSFFGVTCDPADASRPVTEDQPPGYRFFLDHDLSVSILCGSAPIDAGGGQAVPLRCFFILVDPGLNVLGVFTPEPHDPGFQQLFDVLGVMPPLGRIAGLDLPTPVIVLQNVFEPALCRQLIGLYGAHGGEESGFMREVNGRTVPVHDHAHKRRRDYVIEDKSLIGVLQARIMRRIVPAIAKVYQFHVTRMERYIVACYDAAEGGHFRAHRDNTTKGTAHRRFAVSINLNDDFDGGEVSFPEFGPRGFKAPAGGAVIFSCSLLHQVSRVERGKRYAFLPFLYDDAAAALRARNLPFLQTAANSKDLESGNPSELA
jgi:predicted 2-oxoglutarate/Fe(II)-dependent dioxygenase YbiX